MYVSLIIDGSDARADPLGHTNFIPPFTILPVAGFSSPDRERARGKEREFVLEMQTHCGLYRVALTLADRSMSCRWSLVAGSGRRRYMPGKARHCKP